MSSGTERFPEGRNLMALVATVYSESWDINRRLEELGLKQEFLIRAVQRGLAAWASCTPNHPPVSPGSWAWAETVCGFREEVIPLGWKRSNEANLPLTINPDKSVAVCVNTGDEDTGRKDGAPCTGSAKGPRTRYAILENLGQSVLLFDEALPSAEVMNRIGRAMWILLMYRDKKAREVRCELSRPISITPEGYVDGWAERIILTATPFDEDTISLTDGGDGPQSPEIDLEIKKRA
jgi:hypothetical protein